MVSAIRQTCHYLLEIRVVRLLFQMERGINSLRSLNRWACEWGGFLQVSFWERQAELLLCKKSLLPGLISEPGLEAERQCPSLLLRGSSWHPTPGTAAWLCWLSHRQPWGQGNADSEPCLGILHSSWQKWTGLNPSFVLSLGPASVLPLAATSGEFWESLRKVLENWTLPQAAQRHFAGPCSESKAASSVRSFGIIVILEGKHLWFRILHGMRYLLIYSSDWRSGQGCYHLLLCLSLLTQI